MKSIRAKLFWSVGVILLIVAILNYALPEVGMKRELRRASNYLDQYIECIQDQIQQFVSFLVTLEVVQGAAELNGIEKLFVTQDFMHDAHLNTTSPWVLAAQIAAYNPRISFVQVETGNAHSVLITEEATLYSPKWAAFDQGMYWIEIPEKGESFVAVPTVFQGADLYLLFDDTALQTASLDSLPSPLKEHLSLAAEYVSKKGTLTWNHFEYTAPAFSRSESVRDLFAFALWNQDQWVRKIELIQALALWQDSKSAVLPSGMLKFDPSIQISACILKSEIFSTFAIVDEFPIKEDSNIPFLILRESSLDMARGMFLVEQDKTIGIGFSISSLVKKVAKLIQKPILLSWGKELIGFDVDGSVLNLKNGEESFSRLNPSAPTLSWKGVTYFTQTINLGLVQLTLLTPESRATAISRFLDSLYNHITLTASLSLIAATVFSFLLALILLNAISKRVTGPIALLSRASEELGKGNYDKIIFPVIDKRKDEVAVLTHSFKNLVSALRDRDKIRGVLNKVVSREISEEILKHNIELGGEERVLTMLFSDIRGFTQKAEHLDPKLLIRMLNTYMTRMCQVIDKTHGVVDKFVGDEIMALYGAPLPLEAHAAKAVECAICMMEELRELHKEREAHHEPIFEIGIGIHTGVVFIGNMGAENRLNYTAIGANVNLSSRLCSVALPMQILISEATRNEPGVKEAFQLKSLPAVLLKGIDHPVAIYEVVGRFSDT